MASQSHLERQPTTKLTTVAHLLHDECRSDDPRVRNAAYQQVGEYLLRIAHARLRTRPHLGHLAHEATQQALMAIWQKLQEDRGPQHPEWFLSWCGSIVIHKLMDELRKLGRSSVELLMDDEDGSTPHSLLPDPTATAPEDSAIESEVSRELLRLIQEYPGLVPNGKIVLLHGYFLEQDDSELARQLSLATATIRVLRFRALQTLRSDPEFMARLEQLAFPLLGLNQKGEKQPKRRQRTTKSRSMQMR